MTKKCYFCEKRKAKYPMIVYPFIGIEKDVELCSFCYKKYKKIKENYLTKAYKEMMMPIK
jgi:hypothetical protein